MRLINGSFFFLYKEIFHGVMDEVRTYYRLINTFWGLPAIKASMF